MHSSTTDVKFTYLFGQVIEYILGEKDSPISLTFQRFSGDKVGVHSSKKANPGMREDRNSCWQLWPGIRSMTVHETFAWIARKFGRP